MGTPAYMAPEQIQGEAVDFRMDLFSFGILVYEMVTGGNPFEADSLQAVMRRILEHDPPPLAASGPGALNLDRIVATCLRKRPLERYRSTHDLVADLTGVQAGMREPQAAHRSERSSRAAPVATPRLTPRWWWEFHQVATSVTYASMIYPTWRARVWLPPPWGMLFLFGVLATAAAAASLRLHLWFTARFNPSELTALRARAQPWTQWCDAGFSGCLLAGALSIGNMHPAFGILLVTVAVAAAITSYVIEPTTTRAAFRGKSGAFRSPAKPRR
jgi:hypothetical protein